MKDRSGEFPSDRECRARYPEPGALCEGHSDGFGEARWVDQGFKRLNTSDRPISAEPVGRTANELALGWLYLSRMKTRQSMQRRHEGITLISRLRAQGVW